ncbi:MAG: hypothetical protein HY330_04685 [Chloroflexi bacterium]|nr:hypothetical protein [Chloroflexota bacterium]
MRKTVFAVVALALAATACGPAAAPTATPVAQATATRPAAAPTTAPAAATAPAAPAATATPRPAVAPTATAGPTAPRGTITLALRVASSTHDIHLGTRFGTPALSWDSLVHRDFDGSIAPGLATAWKFAPDNLSVEFELRKGVKFHNGDGFSAEDVTYSLERMRRPNLRASYKPNIARISKLEVLDQYKVRAVLSEPFPEILGNLEPFFGVVPKKYTEQIGDTAFMDKPVGTGPFKFVNLVPGDRLTVESFTDHYRRVPQFKTLVVRGIPEAVTRVAALKTGEVDAIDIVPPYEVPSLKANPNTDVVAEDVNETDFFLISTLDPSHPFAKREVRLALNYALNRDALVKDVFYGLARPATTLSAPYESGYDPNLKPYPYDPEKAKQLLAQAGYPNGVDAGKLNYDPAGINQAVELVEGVRAAWAAVGIRMTLNAIESARYSTINQQRALSPIAVFPNRSIPYDGGADLHRWLHSKGLFSHSANPEWDKIIDAAISIPETAARDRALVEANRKMFEEAAIVPVYYPKYLFGIRKDRIAKWPWVKGWAVYPRNIEYVELKR